jgi:hypothetical protein
VYGWAGQRLLEEAAERVDVVQCECAGLGGKHKGYADDALQVVWIGIFQYCFIRVFFTGVAVVSQAFGRYCEASLSPAFAHVWVLLFEAMSVTVAMFMVVQFYMQLKDDLREHRPFLKVLSIKLVIFFVFWQTIVISVLASDRGPLKPTKKLAYQDIKIGISSVMICIEMAAFSVMHMFAYPWKPYSLKHNDPMHAPGTGFSGAAAHYRGGPLGIKAIADAFNPWDIVKALARGLRWMFVGARKRHADPSYQPAKLTEEHTGYAAPPYAGRTTAGGDEAPAPAVTELHAGHDPRRPRPDPYGTEDDRAGLLRDSQAPAGRDGPAELDQGRDLGVPSAGYPPLRQDEDPTWNHWAGARPEAHSHEDPGRPPGYRTYDGYSS